MKPYATLLLKKYHTYTSEVNTLYILKLSLQIFYCMKIYLHSYVIFYIISEKLKAFLKFIIKQMEEEVKLWVLQHAG